MTRPNTRRSPKSLPFTNGLAGIVTTLLLVPIVLEGTFVFIERDSYDPARLLIVIGVLLVMMLGLAVTRRPKVRIQSTIATLMIISGTLIFAFGIAITIYTKTVFMSPQVPGFVEATVGALTPSIGFLLILAGVYLIWAETRRIRARYEVDPVPDIAKPKISTFKNHVMAEWTLPSFAKEKASAEVVSIAKDWLSSRELHYVAFYDPRGICQFYVDVLDDGRMHRFNIEDTAHRRMDYEQAGRYIRRTIEEGDERFSRLKSGILVRAVLDVERGALYFYKLRDQGFLVGVTLSQTEVDPADRKMSVLANEILTHRGGAPYEDFYRKPTYYAYDEQQQAAENPGVTNIDEARDRRQSR